MAILRSSLFLEAGRFAKTADYTHNPGNEFYQKGCQEKSSASTGGEIFFLEIQPTEVSLLWRSLADCPCSYVSSADGGVVIEFQRAASQTAIQGQPWFYPRLVAYGYFWFSEGA